ncbi:AAA family ATPase [Sorangium sp. So ce269]
MRHFAEIWRDCEALVQRSAAEFPQATFTCVRDIYGRCSFAIESLNESGYQAFEQRLAEIQDIQALLGPVHVQELNAGSSLGKLICELRRPLGGRANAFVVERLLCNESWIHGMGENPAGWPPVVAFYSFKGGVGRSTSAALTALTLAREGKRVIVIDLDLEAPGIEGSFSIPQSDIHAGVVDFLLERAVLGDAYRPDIDDFVLPFADPTIAANGGSLIIVPAGKLDETYMERLGRVNLSDIGRTMGERNPIRALVEALLAWRPADVVIVDCRTGFTDVGGMTLNGLSTLDVLVFRGGEADRRYLPVVLRHILRLRRQEDATPELAERLSRSFLIVFTMVELPAKMEEAEQYVADLREQVSETCWKEVFERFNREGYMYPSATALDTPHDPVPHDAVLLPYLRDFAMVSLVPDMHRIQSERPERPYDALVRRIMDVKLAKPEKVPHAVPAGEVNRQKVLSAIEKVTGKPDGETEFATVEDFKKKFVPRTAYRTLLDPKAYIMLGRKGAGKSVLFQLLKHQEYLKSIAEHLGLETRTVSTTRWGIGFDVSPSSPSHDDFLHALEVSRGDPDLIARFWRALSALRLAPLIGRSLPDLPDVRACIERLEDLPTQRAVQSWLDQANAGLEAEGRFSCLSYDDLDVGLTRDVNKRGRLISALADYWQQAPRRWPRIRAKIFLRDDIWMREVHFTDKSKIRDGIDRTTITWDGADIYRTILKRLGHDEEVRKLLRQAGLWRAEFDKMLTSKLGFVPPFDEDWIMKSVHVLAGETMAGGEYGYKKGYVYPWVLTHSADATGDIRPRIALLLFSEAAKIQKTAAANGSILNPRSFVQALRGQVSQQAVADLRIEFKEEWSNGDLWIPDAFSSLERIWPIEEEALLDLLREECKLKRPELKEMLDRMVEAGLIERRKNRKTGRILLQIPDIYLFGLGLTRRG